jgi:tetratricopeptide (TPR) repeat protein
MRQLITFVLLSGFFSLLCPWHGDCAVSVNSRSIDIFSALDPVAFDIDNDKKFEILVAGANGEIGCYDSSTLKPVWKKKLSEKAITQPAIGQFSGEGDFELCVGGVDGIIYIVRAGSGNAIAKYTLGTPVTLAPSIVSLKKLDGSIRDGIIICDDSGAVHLLSLKNKALVEEWSAANTFEGFTVGRIACPASVADTNGDGIPEIITGTVSGTVQAIPLNNSAHRLLWHAPQGTAINTPVSAADLTRSNKDNLIFGTSSGSMIVLSYSPRGTTVFFEIAQEQRLLGPARGHLLISDIDNDSYLDVAAISSSAASTFDGAAQLSNFNTPFATNAPPLSGMAVVRLSNGSTKLVFGNKSNLLISVDATLKQQEAQRDDIKAELPEFCPIGSLTGSGKAEAAYLSANREKLCIAQLDLAIASSSVTILTEGANYTRNGQCTSETLQLRADAQMRFEAAFAKLISNAKTLSNAGKQAEAFTAVNRALELKPKDPEALTLRGKINRRIHLFRNVLICILLLGAIGGAAYLLFLKKRRRGAQEHADAAFHSGDYPTAITEYRSILSRQPQNKRALLALADAYIHAGNIPIEAADVLQQARQQKPESSEYTIALANAFAQQGLETDESLDAYLVALATLQQDRGKIAYHTANILHRRKESDQALRYYKIAIKEGYNEPPVYDALATVFLESNQYSEKTLPVYEQVAKRRPNDIAIVEALCRSFLVARRADERAASASRKLLELRPDSKAGLKLLAHCELQSGNAPAAAELARRLLKISPDDQDNIIFLGKCLSSMERTDANAVHIYHESLKVNAEQPDVQRQLALALLHGNSIKDEDISIVIAASEANPQDLDLLKGLADIGKARGDNALVVSSLEAASALGYRSPESFLTLAKAYASSHNYDRSTESAYREALKSHPDDLQLAQALAHVFMAEGRVDADSTVLYDRVFQRDSSDVGLGKHLSRALISNERYDDAIKVIRYLLQKNQDDQELQKLFAQASLQSNRLDEAIRQYEHLMRQNPNDADATLNLAIAYGEKLRTDDVAGQAYERALKTNATNAVIRLALGRYHAAAGRYARALEEMRQALASDPKLEERICDELRTLLAAAPDRTDVRWLLTNILVERGYLKEAIEQLDAIFENDPSQLKSILQALDRILAKNPANISANLKKGILLKVQGRFEEARPFLENAHKLNPQQPEAAMELEDLYEQVLRESDDIATRFALGKLNYAMGEYDKAIGNFQKAGQDFRFENESIKMLGLCFVGKGMLEFALQEFRKLVIDDEMKEILYDLAQRYEAKNDLVGAKQVYRQLFAADINYKNVKSKFEMLAGSTSDPMTLERTSLMTQLSEKARRRYELVEEIGRGAMGIVYKARDNELDEMVALKIMPDNLSQNPDAVQRFKQEARSARRLAHPNIVRIHDIGEEMGRKYISMEFVEGTDLKRYLKSKGRLSVQEILTFGIQVCQALDYAHSMNIVHRDIKPANIMINEKNTVKVSDFGIAKMLETTGDTIAGAVIGTPLYMSPEQIQGHPIDNRADIYSVGIMLYEFASGRPPFIEGDLTYQHMKVPPKPLMDIPTVLNDIILKAILKDKTERWATAGEFAKALENCGLMVRPT